MYSTLATIPNHYVNFKHTPWVCLSVAFVSLDSVYRRTFILFERGSVDSSTNLVSEEHLGHALCS